MNKVVLIGRVGRDPEIKQSQAGNTICNFSMATTERFKGEEKTEWHNITAFSKLGQVVAEYVTKGMQVAVEGNIQTRSWDGNDGKKRYITNIIARNVEFLSQGRQREEQRKSPRPQDTVETDFDFDFDRDN